MKNEIDEIVQKPEIKFVNNGVLLMFNQIRYEIAGVVVDSIRNPGLASTMKGYVTYNSNESVALENAGWFPKKDSNIIKENGTFEVSIPLKMIFGFCEDFKKTILNVRQELVLVRSNTDVNALISSNDKYKIKVELSKICWKMHHLSVSDAERIALIDIVRSNRELDIMFRSKELHEFAPPVQSITNTWTIKTSLEKPQYILFALQQGRKNQLKKNYSQFDHCNLRDVKLYLNDTMYPYDNLNVDFTNNRYAILYDMFKEFQTSFLSKQTSEPLFDKDEFKEKTPIIVIDCSKQTEALKRGPVTITLWFETISGIPADTTAYCLILHDRMVKYIPAQDVVRVL
ncbi:hypothetical protein DD592_25905 [Enterobacter cloacae complex sp. 2DZ2F20B]|nr:hypothetical protein DD592_25905 [Enterobacter cloacae complex sp. 2DZ2F20B]